ncbi:MAG: hypothetical protein PHE61_08770, partial [Candidatus Omnitrophica bacterium]|nr:hypothetical protein [Candidatus Omnitrophota bacterium]
MNRITTNDYSLFPNDYLPGLLLTEGGDVDVGYFEFIQYIEDADKIHETDSLVGTEDSTEEWLFLAH